MLPGSRLGIVDGASDVPGVRPPSQFAVGVSTMPRAPPQDSRPGSDQQWYQDYCVDNPWEIGVDNTKEFLLATHDEDVRIEGGRIHFNGLEKLPVAAHFVSFAHWPRYNSAMNGYTLSVV